MRKHMVLALILVIALAVTSSCSLVVKDAEVDKQTVIIEVLGKTFTKGEIAEQVEYQLQYQAYMYSMYYGQTIDTTDASIIASAQDSVIEALIKDTAIEAKKAELGSDVFTDEELTQMQASVDSTWQSYVDSVKSSHFAETELTGEELDKAIEDKITELGYYSDKETLLESEKKTKSDEKLRAEIVKDQSVTEDEVKAAYDTRVTSAQSEYASNLSAYGAAVQNGTTVYYAPAGYRYVKNTLVKLQDADNEIITGLNKQISDKQTQLSSVQTSLTGVGEEAVEGEDEIKTQQRADLISTRDTLNTEIADLQTQLSAAKETAYANIQPKIDEITAKLAEGGDFDEVMAEYGEDDGMKNEPGKTNGYLVCEGSTTWLAEFTTASMALAKIGDVSEPFRTSYGVHIVKYVSDLAEGAVAYDTVKDTIQSELLKTRQDEVYNAAVAQWVTDANAKVYKDRLAD